MAAMGKNGQPSMEEILASIRRIVADDPGGIAPLIDLNRGMTDQPRLVTGGQFRVDDSPDFELPSMFKGHKGPTRPFGTSNGVQPAPKAVQVGRLTDAIRNAAPRSQKAATGDAAGQQQTGSSATQNAQATSTGVSSVVQPDARKSLSSLAQPGIAKSNPCAYNGGPSPELQAKQNRAAANPITNGATVTNANGSAPIPEQVNGVSATKSDSNAQSAAPSQQLKPEQSQQASATTSTPRVMAAFRDTRMVRMGGAESATAPEPTGAEAAAEERVKKPTTANHPSETGSSAIGTLIPAAMDLPGRTPSAAHVASPETDRQAVDAQAKEPTPSQAKPEQGVASAPPPLPEGEDAAQASGNVEDATADLLRPMLRQWLSENMPRMVEKALHIEVAASVSGTQNDDGSET